MRSIPARGLKQTGYLGRKKTRKRCNEVNSREGSEIASSPSFASRSNTSCNEVNSREGSETPAV